MSEETTFNALKRVPVDEVLKLLEEYKISISPVLSLGNAGFNRSDFYDGITFMLDKVRIVENSGWTLEDFQSEIEKRSILSMVREYNQSIQFPQDIIDRASKFFPNLKFTQAGIELE